MDAVLRDVQRSSSQSSTKTEIYKEEQYRIDEGPHNEPSDVKLRPLVAEALSYSPDSLALVAQFRDNRATFVTRKQQDLARRRMQKDEDTSPSINQRRA